MPWDSHTKLNLAGLTAAELEHRCLREVSESAEVYNKYYNQAFVVMQYFGYLRREPDALYLNWIAHLEATGDYRSMINGFLNSPEYRARFGPLGPLPIADCRLAIEGCR